MRLFLNKKHKIRAIVSTVLMAVLFMLIMPWGSFYPNTSGFWTSIAVALFVGFVTQYFIVKGRQQYEKEYKN